MINENNVGGINEVIPKPENVVEQRNAPKFSPILMAFSHLIIFGGAYIVLRLYTRFFIIFGIFYIMMFFGVQQVFILLPLIFAFIDTYIQTDKINKKEKPFNENNKAAYIISTLVIIFGFIFYVYGMVIDSPKTEYIDLGNGMKIEVPKSEPIDFDEMHKKNAELKKQMIAVEECTYVNNKELAFDRPMFTDLCQFKYAVEKKDPNYCYHWLNPVLSGCINYLAILKTDKSICDYYYTSDYEKIVCKENVDEKEVGDFYTCQNHKGYSKTFCFENFDDFFKKLQYVQPSPFEEDIIVRESDRDGDGLSNDDERIFGTDPDNKDTNGDGVSDYKEIMNDIDKKFQNF